ncbi:MAG: hypothetical protein WC375_00130 [Methanomassiliicoccales archaeon]|jgi:hypothetical protein
MKIFVATKETQGQRESDFNFCIEGEFVHFGMECNKDHESDIDGKCGCQRSVVGWNSNRATTTFKVTFVDITKSKYLKLFINSMSDERWVIENPPNRQREFGLRMVNEYLAFANKFPIGAIIERRGRTLQVRQNNDIQPVDIYSSLPKERAPIDDILSDMIKQAIF